MTITKVLPLALTGLMLALASAPVKAAEIMAGVQCAQMGYAVIDPIFMGQTVSGFEQWACASQSGINIKGPPFPVVICAEIGLCSFAGWTY